MLGLNYRYVSPPLFFFVQIKALALSASSTKEMTSLLLTFLFIFYIDSSDSLVSDGEFPKVGGEVSELSSFCSSFKAKGGEERQAHSLLA